MGNKSADTLYVTPSVAVKVIFSGLCETSTGFTPGPAGSGAVGNVLSSTGSYPSGQVKPNTKSSSFASSLSSFPFPIMSRRRYPFPPSPLSPNLISLSIFLQRNPSTRTDPVTGVGTGAGWTGRVNGHGTGTGTGTGTEPGQLVGAFAGALVGALTGLFVGAFVGALIGAFVGALTGLFVGALVGAFVGALVGALTGALVRAVVGAMVGALVGGLVGMVTGTGGAGADCSSNPGIGDATGVVGTVGTVSIESGHKMPLKNSNSTSPVASI
jgi:hypothetical protein